jgi:hypothetical protein
VSRETTEARGAARQAAWEWRQHMRYCGPCSRRDRCPDGQALYDTQKAAETELDRQRQLDHAPGPGQAALL